MVRFSFQWSFVLVQYWFFYYHGWMTENFKFANKSPKYWFNLPKNVDGTLYYLEGIKSWNWALSLMISRHGATLQFNCNNCSAVPCLTLPVILHQQLTCQKNVQEVPNWHFQILGQYVAPCLWTLKLINKPLLACHF